VANEAYGMYREALVTEMEKAGMVLYESTKCLEVGPGWLRVALPDSTEKTLEGDTVLYALGMKSVPWEALKAAAGDIPVEVIGDAVTPGKIDAGTRGGYMAAIRIAAAEPIDE
jgi:hypothetical protein